MSDNKASVEFHCRGPYRHKKTGNLYWHLCEITDTTNATDGRCMVLYTTIDLNDPAIFVRDKAEWIEKFEVV